MTLDDFPHKTLADGRIAEVVPLTLGRARLTVCRPDDYGYCYDDAW
jgi:hypothetical protein